MGPAEQRALIAITDRLASQSKFSESGRLEAQKQGLEQVNTGRGAVPDGFVIRWHMTWSHTST